MPSVDMREQGLYPLPPGTAELFSAPRARCERRRVRGIWTGFILDLSRFWNRGNHDYVPAGRNASSTTSRKEPEEPQTPPLRFRATRNPVSLVGHELDEHDGPHLDHVAWIRGEFFRRTDSGEGAGGILGRQHHTQDGWERPDDRHRRRIQRSEHRQRPENVRRQVRSCDGVLERRQPNRRQLAAQHSAGWSLEIALDVEWAHAMAPGANILLVEASSDSLSDLLAAVNMPPRDLGVSGRLDELGHR